MTKIPHNLDRACFFSVTISTVEKIKPCGLAFVPRQAADFD